MLAISMFVYSERVHLPFRVKFTRHSTRGLVGTVEGRAVKAWLDANIAGKYSIQVSHVFFEEHDDALLCYLRYKG